MDVTGRQLGSWLLFLTLLLPSLYVAWSGRDMPEFSVLHDDGLYFVSAQSLASGEGYRIASLPGQPPQTKYPPLYPLFLSSIWRINPNFPSNLELATWFSWALIPIFLALAWRLFLEWGYSGWKLWVLLALLAVNPYLALFGTRLFSELFFTCLLLGALVLSAKRPVLSGFATALAYLTRTAGIALLASEGVLCVWKRDWRRLAWLGLPTIAAAAGWSLWTKAHKLATLDQVLIYYTDYVSYQFMNVDFGNLAVVLWKNIDGLLFGMGALLVPKVVDSLLVKIVTQVIAVAMISGIVRMARRGVAINYALFALISSIMLVVWHFPPNERFVLPLLPLLLAGLFTELEHLWSMLRAAFRHKDAGQRIVARGFAAAVSLVVGLSIVLQIYVTLWFIPLAAEHQRAQLVDQRAAYQWIRNNVPKSTGVVTASDPLLYLETGLRSISPRPLPKFWYAEDYQATIAVYGKVSELARRHGFGYVFFTTEELKRDMSEEESAGIVIALATNTDLEPVFRKGIATVYRVK